MTARIQRIAIAIAALLAPATTHADENWPRFRGAESTGVATGECLPVHWSTTQNVKWKTPIPGRGWSSPVVWGDKIFLTTATREYAEGEKPEEIQKGLYFGGNRETAEVPHKWIVYCLDFETGQILWERVAHEGAPKHGHHLKNTLASETPVTDGERLYAYFGNVGVFCYDFAGELLWSKPFDSHATNNNWGTAASPVLHGDRLIIVNDNDEESFIVVFNKETGEEIWRQARDEKSNWATPYVWQNVDRTEIVVPATGKVRSYSLDGELLWEFGGMSSITIPTPFAHDGLLYIASGYVLDQTRPLYAIQPGAEGDITLGEDETSNGYIVWSQSKGGPYNTTPILYNGVVYVLYDRGILGGFDAKSGEELFRRRIGAGARAFTASPWAYEGRIYCLSEDGVTYVFEAAREFNLLHENNLEEFCMATPAIVRQSLILRTETQLYRIEEGCQQDSTATE
jgi:outer membrane protein assembly factor BamB